MSKKLDLLTKPKFQGSAVSKKLDSLTEPIFQGPAVSKKLDSLTEPIFQNPAVSKKADSLTGDASWRDLMAEAYSWELGLAESDMRMRSWEHRRADVEGSMWRKPKKGWRRKRVNNG